MISLDFPRITKRWQTIKGANGATRYKTRADFLRAAGWTDRYFVKVAEETAAGRQTGVSLRKIAGLARALDINSASTLRRYIIVLPATKGNVDSP